MRNESVRRDYLGVRFGLLIATESGKIFIKSQCDCGALTISNRTTWDHYARNPDRAREAACKRCRRAQVNEKTRWALAPAEKRP